MFVRVIFHPRDDLSEESRRKIEGACLTIDEVMWCGWRGHTLVYRTARSAGEVIASWESEDFSIDEFSSMEFTSR